MAHVGPLISILRDYIDPEEWKNIDESVHCEVSRLIVRKMFSEIGVPPLDLERLFPRKRTDNPLEVITVAVRNIQKDIMDKLEAIQSPQPSGHAEQVQQETKHPGTTELLRCGASVM